MRIYLLVGLPGSGKTYNMEKIRQFDSGTVIDDPRDYHSFPDAPLKDNLIIADPYFCMEATLNVAIDILRMKYPGTEIEVMYFENNPEVARANVAYRNDGREVDGFITLLSQYYNPPENAYKIFDTRKMEKSND